MISWYDEDILLYQNLDPFIAMGQRNLLVPKNQVNPFPATTKLQRNTLCLFMADTEDPDNNVVSPLIPK